MTIKTALISVSDKTGVVEFAQALAQRVNVQSSGQAGLATVTHQPPLYKVRMGPYPSRDEAARTASQLAESTGLNPAIALDQGL